MIKVSRFMDRKPVVGVMPLWDDEKDSIWMLPGYMEGISQAGAIPFIFPFSSDEKELRELTDLCDGFVLTGGHDVSPELYGEVPLEGMVLCCKKRDDMEQIVFRLALKADKPVLGICRGIQFINVMLGGTLFQDIPSQHPSETEHHQKAPYDVPSHEVKITDKSPLMACLGTESISVNSCHHQAVRDLAPGLSVMAMAPDGIVEAVCRPESRFLWAVQWHPEFSYLKDENSRKIFSAFVDAMTRRL